MQTRKSTEVTNEQFAISNSQFKAACVESNIPQTRRQASKWRRKRGKAYTERLGHIYKLDEQKKEQQRALTVLRKQFEHDKTLEDKTIAERTHQDILTIERLIWSLEQRSKALKGKS